MLHGKERECVYVYVFPLTGAQQGLISEGHCSHTVYGGEKKRDNRMRGEWKQDSDGVSAYVWKEGGREGEREKGWMKTQHEGRRSGTV